MRRATVSGTCRRRGAGSADAWAPAAGGRGWRGRACPTSGLSGRIWLARICPGRFARIGFGRTGFGCTGFACAGLGAAAFGARRARAFRLLAGAGGLEQRDQVLLAVADEVGAAHVLQRLAQQRPVLRVVVAQEGLVQPARAALPDARTPPRPCRRAPSSAGSSRCGTWSSPAPSASAGRSAPGRGGSRCFFSHSARFEHVLVGGAGVRGDEVGNQVLLLAGRLRARPRTSP